MWSELQARLLTTARNVHNESLKSANLRLRSVSTHCKRLSPYYAKRIQRSILSSRSAPIRYAKYGYHGSQLSKAVLLLAADKVIKEEGERSYYFPAYEIVNDELRDYRFYKADMLHPNEQAVEYIWEQLVATCFSAEAKQFLEEWRPIKEALAHRPFHPEAAAYQDFIKKTKEKAKMLELKYPNIELNL